MCVVSVDPWIYILDAFHPGVCYYLRELSILYQYAPWTFSHRVLRSSLARSVLESLDVEPLGSVGWQQILVSNLLPEVLFIYYIKNYRQHNSWLRLCAVPSYILAFKNGCDPSIPYLSFCLLTVAYDLSYAQLVVCGCGSTNDANTSLNDRIPCFLP